MIENDIRTCQSVRFANYNLEMQLSNKNEDIDLYIMQKKHFELYLEISDTTAVNICQIYLAKKLYNINIRPGCVSL